MVGFLIRAAGSEVLFDLLIWQYELGILQMDKKDNSFYRTNLQSCRASGLALS